MSFAKNQHYLPASFLNFWGETASTSKYKSVHCFGFANGRFVDGKKSTKRICSQTHLYSRDAANDDDKFRIETFFSRLENSAIPLIKKICADGVGALSNVERGTLTVFFMALQIRTPDSVEAIKAAADRTFRETFSDPQFVAEYRQFKLDNNIETGPSTPMAFMEEYHPEVVANFGLDRIPHIALGKTNDEYHELFYSMTWFIRDFSHCQGKLLIGDNPHYRSTGLDNDKCIFAIPLSPSKALFAVRNSRNMWKILSAPAEEVRYLLNENMVGQAAKWVIGVDDQEREFIKEKFGKGYKKPTFD